MVNHPTLFFGLTGLTTAVLLLSALYWVPPVRYIRCRLWPSFTMTYTLWSYTPVVGRITEDETHELVARNEFEWRDTILRDAVRPPRVGWTSQVGTGVRLFQFQKFGQAIHVHTISQVALRDIRTNRRDYQGFSPAEPSEPGRLAFVRVSYYPCTRPEDLPPRAFKEGPQICRDEPSMVKQEERIEFDASSVDDTCHGGIMVLYERRVNGELLRYVRADSLTITKK